jgi:uncharacterized protein YbjT (DUF2867 family)
MNILLTGASGFIGRNIAYQLNAAGHQVRCVSRSQGFDFCQMQGSADWLPLLEGIDVVINSVGIIGEAATQRFTPLHTLAPQALFRACGEAGVRRVVQISALGADASAFSAYHLSKLAADDYLRSLDLDWFVLRPSLVYGRAGTSSELFMRMARLPLIPLIGSGQQPLQPVHISDVVATVIACLSAPQAQQTLDIVGSQTLSFAEWLQYMRRAQGLSAGRMLHIPLVLAMAGTWLGRWFSPLLQPDNLRMLQTGYLADVQPISEFLGRSPRALEPQLFFLDATTTTSAGSATCSI